MSDDVERLTLRLILEAEAEAIDNIPDGTLEELIDFYQGAIIDVLDNGDNIKKYVENDRPEIIFSTFRILKAIMAEIEYRIKEKKI